MDETINVVLAIFLAMPFALGAAFAVYRRKTKANARRLEALLAQASSRVATPAPEPGALEARLRVLERIVTDKGYDVAEQIEGLR